MKYFFLFVFLFGISNGLISQSVAVQSTKSPEEFFGFIPGSDGNLFDYYQLTDYLKHIDQLSPRVEMREIGVSPMGNKMYIIFVSAPENIAKLSRYKEINKRLALDPNLEKPQIDSLVAEAKVFVLATLSMHSNEVGPTQACPGIVHTLANTQDPEMLKCLSNVVFMIVPCHNPDGMQMVVENYKKYKGTVFEGSALPGVYHKYAGHDNNRDFVTLTQQDNKVIAALYNREWFPQVMTEKHQMGASGVRYFVPPMSDPIAQNIDEGIWNWSWVFGSAMAKDMTAAGCAGVSQHYLFDDYWPGSTATAEWKNIICMLTEAASVNAASPVYIEKNEIQVYGKGLAENKKGINMPRPWEGGWWRLSDIVRYERESTWSLLRTASANREEILRFRNKMCRNEVKKGNTLAPAYFVVPVLQHDQSELVALVNLLQEHGVQVYKVKKDILSNNKMLFAGDVIIPLAQPYRAFIKEVMEVQKYPVRHYSPGGQEIKPYDVTSWSLPLHKGLQAFEFPAKVDELESNMEVIPEGYNLIKVSPAGKTNSLVFSSANNESYKIAFKSLKLGLSVKRTKVNIDIKGEKIPAGSFIVSGYDGGFPEALRSDITISPVLTTENPDTSSVLVKMPRIAIIESWFHDMDAGWTRYIFDQYHIPFTVIRPADLAKKTFEFNYDILVLPDENKNVLMDGKNKEGEDYYLANYPPEFTKGMGKDGFQKILKFISNGGTVLSWGNSTGLFEGMMSIKISETENEEFRFPFTNIAPALQKSGLYCPGSLLKVKLAADHKLTLGMQNEAGIFTSADQVFQTSIPSFDLDRRVILTYPEDHLLVSGYSKNEELLSNYSAMVWFRKGKGNLVLYGFNPQFRASTPGTYKLLFNGLLLK